MDVHYFIKNDLNIEELAPEEWSLPDQRDQLQGTTTKASDRKSKR